MHDTNDFIFEFVEDDDPYFVIDRGSKSFVRRFLKNKTICMNCNKPFLAKHPRCPDCDAITTRNYPDLIEKLTIAPITSLRVGIPGSKFKTRSDSLKGDLKSFMDDEAVGIHAGYENTNFNSSAYSIGVWDLEKLHLISVNLWNILYSVEGQLGNFIEIENVFGEMFVPIEMLQDFINGMLFIFTGHHIPSNKDILIMSPKKNFIHPCFNKITNTGKTIYENDKFINLNENSLFDKFKDCEWYLFFNDHENIFIVPQKRSLLDIREIDDLKRILTLDNISKNYTIKRSWREWDMDDA